MVLFVVIVVLLCVVIVFYFVIIVNFKWGMVWCKVLLRFIIVWRLKEDVKVVKNIIVIFIVFVICIVFINVYVILFYFFWKVKVFCNVENFGFVVYFILYLNVFLNLCIYFIFNDKFCKGLLYILEVFVIWKKNKKNNLI